MSDNREVSDNSRKQIRTRIIRDGHPEPLDTDWLDATPEERIEAVWTLTKIAFGWTHSTSDEPRLRRDIVRVIRQPDRK